MAPGDVVILIRRAEFRFKPVSPSVISLQQETDFMRKQSAGRPVGQSPHMAGWIRANAR